MKKTLFGLTVCVLSLSVSLPLFAYTVILKDGSRLIAQKAPTFQSDQAIIVLQSGTRTSIDAAEIDLERTNEANKNDLGSAMILEGGEFTSQPKEDVSPREERLSDMIDQRRRAGGTATSRPPAERTSATGPRGSATDLSDFQRTPYRDLSVMESIKSAFRSQGIERVKIFEGTSANRLLIEVETSSEAAVFRSLKVAAGALTHLRSNVSSAVDAFELILETASRQRAGQFVMTTDAAAKVAAGEIELTNYYVDNVRF